MGNHEYQKSQTKPKKIFSSCLPLNHVFQFVFFVIGLCIGITLSLYYKNLSFMFQTSTVFSSSPSPSAVLLPVPPPPPPPPPPSPSSAKHGVVETETTTNLMHNLEDKELFWRATLVPMVEEIPYNPAPKVAFLFLTKGPIPLAPIWELFFNGHEGLYSIYVHPHPSYNHSNTPQNSVFHGRRIPSKAVEWGRPTMIDAERRLLASALLDFTNLRFVLLSETCIPLFNFTTIYNYLINARHSFTASGDDPRKEGRGRYNPEMSPSITISDWRKGSQWFEVNRKLAIGIVSDSKYYPVFEKHCSPPCYMDEHYIPTVINILAPEENSNRSVTWVDWSKIGPHPGRFGRSSVSVELVNQIRFGGNCSSYINSNGSSTSSICFLFARKFMPDTLQPLLQIALSVLLNSSFSL
ncbi:hypothetical protein FNV43_RR21344 [Rhamnella rubrinervis]|uniref:Core-2/I-branching beta-1,6-N-acetylglucosaminyltransferase family protein n=1 Tax=Rhamnella rubrinervis TaxID=2594499 RepID=A0A8K0GV02_9ROSA|nr:hypothetical protein FNV43_RR21344 [Rhamnella rubrinervis]